MKSGLKASPDSEILDCNPALVVGTNFYARVDYYCRELTGVSETCENTPGSYICRCPHGLEMKNGECTEDLDECILNTHNCFSNQTCENTFGGFVCHHNETFCPACEETCGDHAQCVIFDHIGDGINIEGHAECRCDPGFEGLNYNKSSSAFQE